MAIFSYTATDLNGKVVRGKESAADKAAFMQKLKDKGLFCTSYTEEGVGKQKDAKVKFKTKDLAFFSRQVSTMLTSGISLVKALSILLTQQEDKKKKAILMEIYDDVQRGKSFSEALTAQGNAFPNLFVSMVAAGEVSGNLDMIMKRLSSHYDKENKTNNKIKSAMSYPMILGIIMVVIVLALFIFVMPSFAEMFTNPDEIPAFTQFLLNYSDSLIHQWYIHVLIVGAIVVGIMAIRKVPGFRLWWDKVKCRIPKAGKLICTIYTSRFAHTMSNLFASGMPMVECIQKSEQVLGNAYISQEFETVIENVKQGESLSTAIARTGIFDGVFTSVIYVGEESGTLDDILEKTADYYDEESDTAINKLTSMLQPVMILIMGVLVCAILLAVYPAMYGAMGSMGV
ncbi:MAG: type II secretion system F family protein [Firmicutes bacterium]|nr:type II secretion system F family protein [[Eubacterium] siraeum]MCM1487938.1 type II secretion system F family protein [Bacillota bacterium]